MHPHCASFVMHVIHHPASFTAPRAHSVGHSLLHDSKVYAGWPAPALPVCAPDCCLHACLSAWLPACCRPGRVELEQRRAEAAAKEAERRESSITRYRQDAAKERSGGKSLEEQTREMSLEEKMDRMARLEAEAEMEDDEDDED